MISEWSDAKAIFGSLIRTYKFFLNFYINAQWEVRRVSFED
jgi:hypothetical protein